MYNGFSILLSNIIFIFNIDDLKLFFKKFKISLQIKENILTNILNYIYIYIYI